MFDDLRFNKKIKNNFLVKEYFNLKNKKYEEKSEDNYKKVNKYLSKFLLKNTKTNKYSVMEKDINKEYSNYKNLTYLKVKELERITEKKGLIPIFVTLTLPSKFHPFKKNLKKQNEYILNKKFEFIEIEQRVNEGYKELNKMWREFYLHIKNNRKNKNMKFIKVIENHKSLQVHLHAIIYINPNVLKFVKKTFESINKKYDLKQTKIEKLEESKGSSYITKYLIKNFKEKELKKLDGWKKIHKIRMFSMSKLSLNTEFFTKLYYSNKELNNQIIEEIKAGKSKYHNLYHFYTKNTKIKKIYIDKYGEIKNEKVENKGKKRKFEIVKIIELEKKFKTKKLLKEKKEEKILNNEGIRKLYYNNKYKELKTKYKIIEKFEDIRIDDKLYLVKIFREYKKTKLENNYKKFDLVIKDLEREEYIYEKNNFILEDIEQYKQKKEDTQRKEEFDILKEFIKIK